MPSQKTYRLVMTVLLVALVATSLVALCIGRYSIDPAEAFGAVQSYLHKKISGPGPSGGLRRTPVRNLTDRRIFHGILRAGTESQTRK